MTDDAPRRPRSTFERLVYVLLAIGVVGFVGLVAAVVAFLATEDGQRVAGGVQKVVGTLWTARLAPGAAALRDAGCSDAFAIPGAAALEMTRALEALDEADDAADEDALGATIVICEASLLRGAPSCEALAMVYAEAAEPEGAFQLTVQREDDERVCDGWFDATGAPLPEEAD